MKDRTPRRILVAIDFSPASRRALRYATDLANQTGAMLDAVHVLTPMVPLAVGPEPVAAAPTTARPGAESAALLVGTAINGLAAYVYISAGSRAFGSRVKGSAARSAVA